MCDVVIVTFTSHMLCTHITSSLISIHSATGDWEACLVALYAETGDSWAPAPGNKLYEREQLTSKKSQEVNILLPPSSLFPLPSLFLFSLPPLSSLSLPSLPPFLPYFHTPVTYRV